MTLNNEYCLTKYKNLWLTPMKKIRAFTLKNKGKAKIYVDKFTGLLVCKLLYKPSGFKVINYNCGFDPGSLFNNIIVVSDKDQYSLQHNLNSNFINTMQEKVADRSIMRRNRRFHKRMRESRFSNRIGHKISYTSNHYYNIRFMMIKEISKRFNVKNINIELPNTARSKSFQYLSQGINRLSDYCNKLLNIDLTIIKGTTTYKERINRLGIPIYEYIDETYYDNDTHEYETIKIKSLLYIEDIKNQNKSDKDWNCHSIDSFILATLSTNKLPIHSHFYIMSRNYTSNRFDNRNVYSLHRRPKWVTSRWKGANRHYHKIIKTRSKVDVRKSNHGPWLYKYQNQKEQLDYLGFTRYGYFEAGYTDYQGRYYNHNIENGRFINKPMSKFYNPITKDYRYNKLEYVI